MARLVPHPRAALAVAAVTLVAPAAAHAYIGPGAGFAVMSSFLVILVTMVAVAASILAWPFRALWRVVRAHRPAAGRHRPLHRHRLRRTGSRPDRRVPDRGPAPELREAAGRRASTAACRPPTRRSRRWPGRRSAPAPIRHGTTSSTSSIAIAAPICRLLSSTRIGKVERFLKLGKYLHSAGAAGADQPAAIEAVLDHPRRAAHLEHDPARADHVSRRIASTARS